jgi:RNA polymerase sigma-70 factor (ECF subfamily)
MGARNGTSMELAAAMTTDARREFGDLLERHRGIVLKVAGSYAANPDDRADLAQDIAAQLWRAWPSYEPQRPVTTWMYRIALNVAISHLRGRSLRDRHQIPLDDGLHDVAGDAGGDSHAASQQLRLLRQVIAKLPPMDRALMLLYLDERSHREIAEILGIGESNVATKVSRLKQRIRDELT